MDWFRKLPGFERAPHGFEWKLLRRMPWVALAGTALPLVLALAARLLLQADTPAQLERALQRFDFMMIGLLALVWTLVLTVVIGCVIVWIMKGPAYVADPLTVSHRDAPRPGARVDTRRESNTA